MKFFKHFTDANRGKSMQQLLRSKNKELGMKAIGIYWTIVEMCAEKMTKEKDQEYTDSHCNFEFNTSYIRDTLALHRTATLSMYLRWFGDVGLMSSQCTDDVTSIYMPKLLECLDRDTKRARTERAPSAPKRKKKEKEKEIDIPHAVFDFELVWKKYPRKLGKAEGMARLATMIKTNEDYQLLLKSIDRYVAHLSKSGTEEQFMKHFPSFLGTSKKQTWRDWLETDVGRVKVQSSSPAYKIINSSQNKPLKIDSGNLSESEIAEVNAAMQKLNFNRLDGDQ